LIKSAANGYLAGVDSGRQFASRTSDEDAELALTGPDLE
jgi:hypothetical protein